MSTKLISTIVGIALAITSIISAVGIITAEQATELTKWIPSILEAVGSIIAIFGSGKMEVKNIL
jgi:hypothetical protein